MVLSILLLNYFDKFYIRSCVVVLLTSLGLDIVWLFVLAGVKPLLLRLFGILCHQLTARLSELAFFV